MDYHNHHMDDTRIVRIFNTYGPRMDIDDGRVVTNFISQALKSEPITLYGTGEQTRSFCYIDDQLDGLIALMNSNHIHPVNIGNDNEITVRELACAILELIPTNNSIIIHTPLPSDDPTNRRPNITRAKTILGWTPKYDLKSGLLKTIDYFKNLLEKE